MKYLEEKRLLILDELDLRKDSQDMPIEKITYTDIRQTHPDSPRANNPKHFEIADYVIIFIRGEMKVMKHRYPVHIGNKKYW